jgi:hypothetical protein
MKLPANVASWPKFFDTHRPKATIRNAGKTFGNLGLFF